MYLLDTNVCLDFALARSNAVRDKVRSEFGKGLAISSITLAELRVGARHVDADPKDEQQLDVLIRLLAVHAFDDAAAEAYGQVARLIGITRRSFDRLIAAHAIALGLKLVTNNETDFAAVPGLNVENWRTVG